MCVFILSLGYLTFDAILLEDVSTITIIGVVIAGFDWILNDISFVNKCCK